MTKYSRIGIVILCAAIVSLCGCDVILRILQKEIGQETELLGDTAVAHNPQIEYLQKMLQSLGYAPGIIDGQIGFRTRSAIKKFQEDYGLEDHGYVDRKTWDRLIQEYETIGLTLERLTPKQIQAALKAAGFSPGSMDGKMGVHTIEALKKFQKSQGLQADGKVGIRTWRVLKEFLP
ncbi:MAG: peptidoglycan-binding protein [Candidatus Omnitrophica bacterium]|nr:peptidoglycan-binding protein [Candidatus Omnitrophota bacterium]